MKKLHIGTKILAEYRDGIEETDTLISEFYIHHKRTFRQVFLLYILMYLFWAFEFYFCFRIVGAVGVSLIDSFLILALGNLAYSLPAVPASVGIYEITYVTIFRIMQIAGRSGMAVILIRRVLGLLFSALGFIAILNRRSLRVLKG